MVEFGGRRTVLPDSYVIVRTLYVSILTHSRSKENEDPTRIGGSEYTHLGEERPELRNHPTYTKQNYGKE